MSKEVEKKVITDFLKSSSCAYATTNVLGHVVGVERDDFLLRSVVGFSSGLATMGDTCGAVNGGVMVLGKRFPELSTTELNAVCAEYFGRLEQLVGTPDCGQVHGGKHLASNFRRSILTGKSTQCAKILRNSSTVLTDLVLEVEQGNFKHNHTGIEKISRHFEENSFHCCQSTIAKIASRSGMNVEPIQGPSGGFCGGIGFNGTLCGAIAGGVLCLGLQEGVDLSRSTYKDALRIILLGLIKSDGLFRDEKRYLPAKLFNRCQELYHTVEAKYGGAHCREILSLRLDTEDGIRQYIAENKIDLCRSVIQIVAETVVPARQSISSNLSTMQRDNREHTTQTLF